MCARADVKTCNNIKGKLNLIKYWINPVYAGMAIHVGNRMQFIASTIDKTKNKTVEIGIQKPLVNFPGDKAKVMYLNRGNLRVMGTIEL